MRSHQKLPDVQKPRKLSLMERLHHPTHALSRVITHRVFTASVNPFGSAKKKCLPEPSRELLLTEGKTVYYSVSPFTTEDRDGPSFRGKQMANLIVDGDGKLLKLILEYETQERLPLDQIYIEAEEFSNGEGMVVARKFKKYIAAS